MSISSERDTKGSGKTKIGQFEVTILVNEQVLGLQVTVKHAVRVAISHTVAKLIHEFSNDHIIETQCLQAC